MSLDPVSFIDDSRATIDDQLVKSICEDSLYEFVQTFWDIVEPGRKFVPNWHIEWLCKELEAVTRGEQTRLLVNVPPGAMKSLLTCCFWPCFEWGPANKPSLRYLFAAYTQELPVRDNRRAKMILQSELYKRLWPHVRLDQNRISDENFGNTSTGWRIATSPGGIGTGERADRFVCLPYETEILTSIGWVKIGDIVSKQLPVGIAGRDGDTVIWQQIEAYEASPGRRLFEIDFGSGSLRCTGDHPIWTEERGFVRADGLRAGETVRTLGLETLRAVRHGHLHEAESPGETAMVQPRVPWKGRKRDCSRRELGTLFGLREASLSNTSTWQEDPVGAILQPRMPRQVQRRSEQPDVHRRAVGDLRVVREAVPQAAEEARVLLPEVRQCADQSGYSRAVGGRGQNVPAMRVDVYSQGPSAAALLEEVLGSGACEENSRSRQRSLCARPSNEAISARLDVDVQGADQGAGRPRVPPVRDDAAGTRTYLGRSPHQLSEGRFGTVKPDNLVPVLPWKNARQADATGRMGKAIVRSVRRLDGHPSTVFNVRVGPCHNYFAEGVLVHNCDDVHSVKTVESDLVRQETLRWWREVVPTRVNDAVESAFVVIMQRVHEEDVAGDILENREADGWSYVMVPMRYEPDRHCVTDYGEDPRGLDENGELLEGMVGPGIVEPGSPLAERAGELYWPEKFPDWTVRRDSVPLGRFGVAAQFQQLPAPRGGGIVLRSQWQLWPPDDERDSWVTPLLDAEGRPVFDNDGKPMMTINFPTPEYTIAYVDTAFTEQQENAFCAYIVWSVFMASDGRPKVVMRGAWQGRPTLRELCLRLHKLCQGKVDTLLIENKAGGVWVKQEMTRLLRAGDYSIVLDNPEGDKVARLHQVTPMFEGGLVYAPDRVWADMVISQVSSFPKGKFRDLVDCVSGGLGYLRRNELIKLTQEFDDEQHEQERFRGNSGTVAEAYGVS